MAADDRTTKYFSEKQEKLVSKYLGWSTVSGSGNRPCRPGDLIDSDWLGECKTHMKPNHRIIFLFNIWDKIQDEANSCFKHPILIVDDGSQDVNHTWCCVSKATFPYPCRATPGDFIKITRSSMSFVHGLGNSNYISVFRKDDSTLECGMFEISCPRGQFYIMPLTIFQRLLRGDD